MSVKRKECADILIVLLLTAPSVLTALNKKSVFLPIHLGWIIPMSSWLNLRFYFLTKSNKQKQIEPFESNMQSRVRQEFHPCPSTTTYQPFLVVSHSILSNPLIHSFIFSNRISEFSFVFFLSQFALAYLSSRISESLFYYFIRVFFFVCGFRSN